MTSRSFDLATPSYASLTYWLETCNDDLTPRPSLEGNLEADVAILGAGYSGLWTAYYLLKRMPDLRVALVEAEIAGYGGSGRNGGWLSAGFPLSATALAERFGTDTARNLLEAVIDSVDEVMRVCASEDIDAGIVKSGALRIARGAAQVPALRSSLDGLSRLGLDDHYQLLDREELGVRVRVANARAALFTENCAVIHPGRLVRGLARTVERMGATIFERTTVVEIDERTTGGQHDSPRLLTARGSVTAESVILAGEAYLTRLSGLHRSLLPAYSSIVLTEPLPQSLWEEIGWQNRECMSSNRLTVDYLSRTTDDRILLGSRGRPYRFGSRIGSGRRYDLVMTESLTELLRAWFPCLKGVDVTHSWSGPVGMPRDWMPSASFHKQSGIATARGYTGQGVANSNLAGRMLTDLIAGTESALTELPMANHRSPNWEVEPLRWLAVRSIQRGLEHIDANAETKGMSPTGRSIWERLSKH